MLKEPLLVAPDAIRRYEYKVIDTGKRLEEDLNDLGAEGWQVVGATTKKTVLPLLLRRRSSSCVRCCRSTERSTSTQGS